MLDKTRPVRALRVCSYAINRSETHLPKPTFNLGMDMVLCFVYCGALAWTQGEAGGWRPTLGKPECT